MAVARTCSECGGSLEGRAPSAKTCSVRCRQKRARRRHGVNNDVAAQVAEEEVAGIVRREADGVVRNIMKQELTPVVREAIDEDVMRAIQTMVGLTTKAVAALEEDLDSTDTVLRQRAAALVVKYTVGHPALVKSSDEKHEPLVVNFNLPRPEDADDTPAEPAYDAEGEVMPETKVCDICGKEKPLEEFVAGSERCAPCHEELKARVMRELA